MKKTNKMKTFNPNKELNEAYRLNNSDLFPPLLRSHFRPNLPPPPPCGGAPQIPASPPPPPPPPPCASSPPSRSLSTATASSYSGAAAAAASDVARSIAAELTKLSSADRSSSSEAAAAAPLDLDAHFSLHFSDVRFDTALLRDVLALSLLRPRRRRPLYHLPPPPLPSTSDASLALLVHHLSRRRDFKAVSALLSEFRPSAGPLSLSAALSRLARAGRPTHATRLFADLPSSRRDRPLLAALVSSLADAGFPGHAERAARHHATEIFPDEHICTALVRGWSAAGKLDEALRLLGEARRGGFDLGPPAYNSILDCICRLCRKKDPLRLPSEAEKFLVDMEATGIPRDSETFRVLITNLCKIRRTEDAVTLFRRMGEWGCSPDADTYLALIRSLYQAARVSEGDEMIRWMRLAGFGDRLDRKAYYGFIKILCGIERVEHAMKVLG
uniref:Pentatricopeptide repeat-containing protein n=1 Tax=Ananas comosus var. bracteatus TaxID=296719 RepID=A0A6V7PNE4_ANACO|nr:unnamed protein product [Ananas comosus var. bracteatus]